MDFLDQSIKLGQLFSDLKDKRCTEAIAGYGAVRTPTGGSKIVIWLRELCALVVRQVRLSIHRHSECKRLC